MYEDGEIWMIEEKPAARCKEEIERRNWKKIGSKWRRKATGAMNCVNLGGRKLRKDASRARSVSHSDGREARRGWRVRAVTSKGGLEGCTG